MNHPTDRPPTSQIPVLLAEGFYKLQQKDHVQVTNLVRQILAQEPDNADALYLLGMSAQALHRLDMAENLLTKAIARNPNQPYYHYNLSTILTTLGRHQEAKQSLMMAIQLKPDLAEAHINLGNLLFAQGDRRAAVEYYLNAVQSNPNLAIGYYNLGVIFQEYGEHVAALEQFDLALRCAPQEATAHMGRAASLLKTGHFVEGWEEYEWRFRLSNHQPRICPVPRWDGSSPQGQRIYVYTEQGFGDALMFARYAPLIRSMGGVVYLECRPELHRLFASSSLADRVEPRDMDNGDPPPFDYDRHIPLMSLPHLLGTTLATIPASIPYLTPDPQRVTAWEKRLGTRQRLRVGLSWSGNPAASVNQERACTLQDLLPLTLIPDVTFYSLQKGPPAAQLTPEWCRHYEIETLEAELTDFTETAAALLNLDLLISTDTAIVHLAGGLGIPVWTILHTAAEWRWLESDTKSPWYPSMQLFRQQNPGDWSEVINRVRTTLANKVLQT